MTSRFENKTVLVTGGGGGIGRAAALAFSAEGGQVVVTDRRRGPGEDTVRMIQHAGGTARFVLADISQPADCAEMVGHTLAAFGRLDVAFNNAGMSPPIAPTVDIDFESWNQCLAVNLTGIFLSMKYEIAAMKRSGGGAIVNTASVAGLVGARGSADYCASKHGVIGLTRTAALDHIGDGIRINAICPGATDTDMLRTVLSVPGLREQLLAANPIQRIASPEEMVRAVLFLASEEASYVVGQALAVDGGITAQ